VNEIQERLGEIRQRLEAYQETRSQVALRDSQRDVPYLIEQVERLRRAHQCERYYVAGLEGVHCVVCGKEFGEE
jgi:hypothetical protein